MTPFTNHDLWTRYKHLCFCKVSKHTFQCQNIVSQTIRSLQKMHTRPDRSGKLCAEIVKYLDRGLSVCVCVCACVRVLRLVGCHGYFIQRGILLELRPPLIATGSFCSPSVCAVRRDAVCATLILLPSHSSGTLRNSCWFWRHKLWRRKKHEEHWVIVWAMTSAAILATGSESVSTVLNDLLNLQRHSTVQWAQRLVWP